MCTWAFPQDGARDAREEMHVHKHKTPASITHQVPLLACARSCLDRSMLASPKLLQKVLTRH